jgi:hypothetical protein
MIRLNHQEKTISMNGKEREACKKRGKATLIILQAKIVDFRLIHAKHMDLNPTNKSLKKNSIKVRR